MNANGPTQVGRGESEAGLELCLKMQSLEHSANLVAPLRTNCKQKQGYNQPCLNLSASSPPLMFLVKKLAICTLGQPINNTKISCTTGLINKLINLEGQGDQNSSNDQADRGNH